MTGGSDGIGLAMCHKLAKEGFNICIVARNEAKIEEKLEEIREECPNVSTLCIVADFDEMRSMQDYREKIGDRLKDYDVGILVANAGVGLMGPFTWLEDKHVESIV